MGGNAPARSPAGQGSRPPSGPLALIVCIPRYFIYTHYLPEVEVPMYPLMQAGAPPNQNCRRGPCPL